MAKVTETTLSYIEIDQASIQRVLRELAGDKKAIGNVTRRAGDRAGASTKTEVSRLIRDEIDIKASDLNKANRRSGQKVLFKTRVKEDAGTISTKVVLTETGRTPLKYYKAKQSSKGVTYRISKRQGRKLLAGAFIPGYHWLKGQGLGAKGVGALPLGGHVFIRTSKSRLPIQKLYGVSPWGAFVKNNLVGPVTKFAGDVFNKRLTAELEFELSKRGANTA